MVTKTDDSEAVKVAVDEDDIWVVGNLSNTASLCVGR